MKIMLTHLHVDIDSVDTRNAKMYTDPPIMKEGQIRFSLGLLRVIGIKKLDQSPILDDALGHSNLTVRRLFDHTEKFTKFRQISKIRRQMINIQRFGMKAGK